MRFVIPTLVLEGIEVNFFDYQNLDQMENNILPGDGSIRLTNIGLAILPGFVPTIELGFVYKEDFDAKGTGCTSIVMEGIDRTKVTDEELSEIFDNIVRTIALYVENRIGEGWRVTQFRFDDPYCNADDDLPRSKLPPCYSELYHPDQCGRLYSES